MYVIISLTILFAGLDTGDRKALDHKFSDSQCLMDTEDRRFVLKGPQFPPMEVSLMNTILYLLYSLKREPKSTGDQLLSARARLLCPVQPTTARNTSQAGSHRRQVRSFMFDDAKDRFHTRGPKVGILVWALYILAWLSEHDIWSVLFLRVESVGYIRMY